MSHEMLNSKQREAVDTLEGPVLILAGAGAGKTKTITHRILNLIKGGVRPSQILAITFTNKAAKEMRERVYHLIESDPTLNIPISFSERPFVSTFHALGVHIIKENAPLIGLTRHFTIFDRGDSKRAVKEALEELSIDPKEFEPGTLLNAISREKGDAVTMQAYKERAKDFYSQLIARVWERYEATLFKERALDFDDLLLKTMVLLRKYPEVRKKYNFIWKYVHIDEYQDTNRVQYEIATMLSEETKNLCVVGDIDQNIYSWRGADIQNILNFEKEYPHAKIILLEENYRSTQTILTAANNVIKKNVVRREKNLFTKNGEGEKIELLISYTEQEEARMISEKIRELIEGGTSPREIAVLYRANFQSRVIEESFLRKNIPYQLLGVKFFERKEVKDVLSFIKASLNRESASDLIRIINVPPRGIGKATLLKVLAGQEATLGPALKQKVSQFMMLLDRIKEQAGKVQPSLLIKYILTESGIEKTYREGGGEEQEKLENLRELVSVATQYDALPMEEALEALLQNAALATDQDELEKNENAVKMMTVHASKGLEFDNVFIAGLEEDLFPHVKIGEKDMSPGEAEEERRLFYVALTRARKQIFLSYAMLRTIYGSQKVNTPSHFISDIGDEHITSSGSGDEPRGVKAIFIDF
ncbi:MAG: UvrD-helicase domain-containing protein [Patescibacteria group bacterium]